MILREPELTKADCSFIADCYEDWPPSDRGPVWPQDVRKWIKRFPRTNEKGLIGMADGLPVSFVLFSQAFFVAKIHELVVHPNSRQEGHGRSTWKALRERLVGSGVVVAGFDAIPGPIAEKTLRGDFRASGEAVGEHTGLPLVKGYVTSDMDV